jgi:hypothetical protein
VCDGAGLRLDDAFQQKLAHLKSSAANPADIDQFYRWREQRLGCDSETGQGGEFSHARWMSHPAGNRHHDLPGKRRTARAA